MAQDAITVTGIEQYQEALRKMQTDNHRPWRDIKKFNPLTFAIQPVESDNSTA